MKTLSLFVLGYALGYGCNYYVGPATIFIKCPVFSALILVRNAVLWADFWFRNGGLNGLVINMLCPGVTMPWLTVDSPSENTTFHILLTVNTIHCT